MPAATKRVGLLPFSGPGATVARAAVNRALAAKRWRVIEVKSADVIASAADEHRLAAVVGGRITKKGKLWTASIDIRKAEDDGDTIAAGKWTARGSSTALSRGVFRGFWKRFGRILERQATRVHPVSRRRAEPPAATKPIARAEPETAAEPEPETAPEPAVADIASPPPRVQTAAPTSVKAPPPDTPLLFELTCGPRMISRRLGYRGDSAGALVGFRTALGAPAVGLGMAMFPFAGIEGSFLARFGIGLRFEYGLPLSSQLGSLSYRSPHSDLNVGIGYRLGSRLVTIDLEAGGGWHRFAVTPEGEAVSRPRPVPDVAYQYLRPGAGLRVQTGRLGWLAGGYYRHVLDAGPITSTEWFPLAQVRGFEGILGAGWRLHPRWELRAMADLRWYRMQTNATASSIRQADAASDLFIAGWLAAALVL